MIGHFENTVGLGFELQSARPRAGSPYSGGKAVVDPDLSPQSTSEISGGVEYEIIKYGRVGLNYVRRWVNDAVDDMSNDEAATYFIGSPGKGIGSGFPEARRDYDTGTVYLRRISRINGLCNSATRSRGCVETSQDST